MSPDLLDAPRPAASPRVPRVLLAPPRLRPVVALRPPRPVVAAFLARAVQGDASTAAIHETGAALLAWAVTSAADPVCDRAMAAAVALRDRAAALPETDRAPVVVAMLRDLLDDAGTQTAVDFDKAIVAAARVCGTTPTAAQRGTAAGIVAEVMG